MHGIETILLLLIASAVVATLAHWVRFSYTLALLLFGLVAGLVGVVEAPALSSDVILLLFLPPLLFEASFVLDLRQLWAVRLAVSVLALPGVLLAMVVGGALVHWGVGLPWTVALLFGAIVAATDPVAVLAIFRELKVAPRLTALVEGESLLNDGVALVLLVTLSEAVDDGFEPATAVVRFVAAVGGGVAIGVVVGWLGHALIALIDDHLTEMVISMAVAYGAFLAAEEVHVSGVLATIAAAMALGELGRRRGWIFSDGSERTLVDLWEFLAFLANATLFLLMGLTIREVGLGEHPSYALWGVAAALLGRAVVAYGVGPWLGRLGTPMSGPERHVLFWAGLRGAVALAAALSLPADFPHRAQLLAMTYGAVLFTLLAQGLTIARMMRSVGIPVSEPPPHRPLRERFRPRAAG